MKRNLNLLRTLACLAAGSLSIHNSSAVNSIWSGASAPDLSWSTAGNWSPSGSPSTNDSAIFFDASAAGDNVTINNNVTADTTIRMLWLAQTNGIHNMSINSGVTLTVAGTNYNGYGPLGSDPGNTSPTTNGLDTVFVGTRAAALVGTVVQDTISGGGTLVVNNPNNEMMVRQVFAGGGGAHQAILDMSGLNTFVAHLGRIRVGDGEFQPFTRAQGQLFLAKTNNITLTGTNSADNVQLVVGNNDVNNNGNSAASFVYLGQANTLNIDKILIGGGKTPAQFLINPLFVSTTPSLVMRGSDGVGRMSAFRIGDESDAAATSNPTTGTVNLLSAISDILADTIIVGKGQNGSGNTTAATGILTVGSGVVDVNTLDIASQFHSAQGGVMTGTATFSNTTVVVNKLLRFGHFTGGAGARNAALNIAGGSFTVMSNIVTEGTATIRVTNSVLQLRTHPSILASVMVLDNASISNAATLKITNSLTIVDNGTILGNPVLDMGRSPSAVWDVQGALGGDLTVNNAFQGSGTLNGNLVQSSGATISPGGPAAAGTLTIAGTSGNVTLNAGTLNFDLSNSSGGVNDLINASGTVTLNGTNAVDLTALNGVFDTSNPYTLINSGGLVGGNQTYFTPAGGLGQSRYTFTFTTDATSVKLSVAGVGPANLTWVGGNAANAWDLKNTFNWSNGSSAQFFSLDAVTFNDTGSASPAVNLVGPLNPGAITVNNPTKSYTFSGTGGLTSDALTKDGAGSLTFNHIGDNSFGGLVTVLNGAVTFGNTGQNTFVGGLTLTGGSAAFAGGSTNIIAEGTSVAIGTGTSLTLANTGANDFNGVPVQLDGALTVTQAVNSTIGGNISGGGTLVKAGSGTLTLAGDNGGLSSVVLINGGTIKAGTPTSLGTTGVIITNSATLDLNGKNLGAIPVTVSGSGAGGNGAIVSSLGILISGSVGIGMSSVTMAGNTTIGGSGPWDTDPIKNVGCWGFTGTLSTGGTNFSLTKVGLNQVSLNNATVDAALGNIDVQAGLLDLAAGTTSLGNPTNTITVEAGAQVSFNASTTPWDKQFVLFGDGVTPNLLNYNGANTIIGSVTLNSNSIIGAVPLSRGAPVSLTLSGSVGGTGSLIKSGTDALILAGTNTYTGTTTVSGGSLFVEGVSGTNSVTVSGGTLGGLGVVRGVVTVSSGGTLSPGDTGTPLGTLSISKTLNLGGTCVMDVDRTSGIFSGDLVTNITTLTLGGTLQLNLTGETLVAGDSFKLFSFGSASGAFTSISPAIPADGLAWDTSSLTANGTLKVIVTPPSQPVIGSVTLSGADLVLNITNGVAGGTNYVLASTNVALPLNQWAVLATNIFDVDGSSLWTNTVDASKPQRFFLIQLP